MLTALRYARAEASTTSVATPRPVTLRPSASTVIATAPNASEPPVTDDTWKLPTVPRTPVASEIAAMAASIMPSPVPFASILPSSWPSTTRAVGFAAVPPCSSSSWIVNRCTMRGAELLGDDRFEVGFGDLDLLVGELLEAHERAVERVALHVQAHLLERVGERVAAGVLAEHDLRRFLADRRRVDDLVGLAVGEHAVLVDAGLVRERVAADDRLVELHVVAGEPRHEAGRARELLGAHVHGAALEVVARAS